MPRDPDRPAAKSGSVGRPSRRKDEELDDDDLGLEDETESPARKPAPQTGRRKADNDDEEDEDDGDDRPSDRKKKGGGKKKTGLIIGAVVGVLVLGLFTCCGGGILAYRQLVLKAQNAVADAQKNAQKGGGVQIDMSKFEPTMPQQ
ncbi:hypothetical protein FRUB_05133 [Fimbriiglobus ruber]|uniref:Uncharacterized protein n=1 Tax=Fimbriiglobus ruber TaxID=1908690 RepID=A0A225DKN6_9BACT|nr:hypothetical protein FRUB_05133 [Fimbriiglobus ruber]